MADLATLLPQSSIYTGTPTAIKTDSALATPMAAVTMPAFANPLGIAGNLINVRKNMLRQDFHGVGVALTDVSAWTIMTLMTKAQRTALFQSLFVTLGVKLVRVPMGSTDCNGYGTSNQGPGLYTYDDGAGASNGAGGSADATLASFSLGNDLFYNIPCMQEIAAVAPDVKFMFEPHSPPGWLKSSGAIVNGAFVENSTNFGILGQYFLKHYQAVTAYGIFPWAYGVQNEPDDSTPGYANCTYTASGLESATAAIRSAFDAAGVEVLIYGPSTQYANASAYYASIVASDTAGGSIDIVSSHSYSGSPYTPQEVLRSVPGKTWMHSEYCFNTTGSRPYNMYNCMAAQILPAIQAGASAFLWWNLAMPLPSSLSVYCNNLRPCVYVTSGTGAVTYNGELYGIAQIAAAAKPGAKRVDCTINAGFPAAAFINPDQSVGVVVYNNKGAAATFAVQDGAAGQISTISLNAGDTATVNWAASNPASAASGSLTAPGAPTLGAPTTSGSALVIPITAPAAAGSTALGGGFMYRGSSSGAETLLGAFLPSATSYTDTNPTGGSANYYYAKVQGGGGVSVASNEVSGAIALPPTNVVGSATQGNAQNVIALSAYANGYAVTSFQILRGTTSGGEGATAIATVTPTSPPTTGTTTASYTDTGLTNNTEYYYEIVAVCSAGNVTSPEFTGTPVAPASSGTLTPTYLTPVPGQAFSTPLTGGSGSITATATSSDGTLLTCSGTGSSITLTGTWPLSASGTNPAITIVPSSGSNTVVPFGVATLLDPSTIPSMPTLADWVRADTGVTSSSGAVTAVSSRGGGGAYSIISAGPSLVTSATLNNQPAFSFNGTTQMLAGNSTVKAATASSPGASMSAVFVAPSAMAGDLLSHVCGSTDYGYRALIAAINTEAVFSGARSTDAQSSGSGSTTANSAIVSGTAYSVLSELNLPTGTSELRLNGAVSVTGTVTTATTFPTTSSNGSAIGGVYQSASTYGSYFNSVIAEVRVFRGILTTLQKEMLEGYDAWRYALTLASGHPFKTYPPTALGLSNLKATHGSSWTAQVSGLPSGATSVTATSSTGEALTVTSGVVSGTFTAAGSSLVTLAATYNGVSLTGTATVSVS